ncbi:hypothetical protein PG999_013260 [Apiospora kogelbergensis]|uniref:Uncharacterized protein n=1 Tax=Apiospora kogelbergensis TaxID=1337665 RepID=A0AAW0QBP3_9PEZI
MEQAQPIHPRQSLTLDLPPSCIEFCPASPRYFVVGTYNLQKEEGPTGDRDADSDGDDTTQVAARQSQTRNGSLVVFQLDDDDEVQRIQTVQQPSAILDLHFHPQKDTSDVMAVVSSTGTLSFFRLEAPSGDAIVTLTELATHQPLGGGGNTLFLSCCWHPILPDLIFVTTSTFEVHVFRVDDAWNIIEASEEAVLVHTLEAWTVAISPVLYETVDQRCFTIYSGGDDSMLLQTSCSLQDGTSPLETVAHAIKTKGHGAGVTAILPLDITFENNARVVLTGSYDDNFRIYAAYESSPNTIAMRAQLLQETNLDGGVWRLKLVSLTRQPDDRWEAIVLASCMHAGSRVLRITGSSKPEECEAEVVARFEEHKSMNYGSDFQPGSEAAGRALKVVSTSFYDKLICFWVLPRT